MPFKSHCKKVFFSEDSETVHLVAFKQLLGPNFESSIYYKLEYGAECVKVRTVLFLLFYNSNLNIFFIKSLNNSL